MTGSLKPGSDIWSYNILWFGPTEKPADKLARNVGAPTTPLVPHGKVVAMFKVGPALDYQEDDEDRFMPFIVRRDDLGLQNRGAWYLTHLSLFMMNDTHFLTNIQNRRDETRIFPWLRHVAI